MGALLTLPAHLRLAFDEYEENDPAKGDYVSFRASVSAHGFAGETELWSSRSDVEAFCDALASVCGTHRGAAELVGGYDREEYLRIHIAPVGPTGRLLVQVTLVDDGVREGTYRRVRTEFITLPPALTAFLAGMRRMMDGRASAEVQLDGEVDEES